jgi:hypothetical protein
MGGRHVVAARISPAVGTVFIASAAASGPGGEHSLGQGAPTGGSSSHRAQRSVPSTQDRGASADAMNTVPTAVFSPSTVQKSDAHPLLCTLVWQ